MALKLTANRKLLVGGTIQLTSSLFYVVSAMTLDHVPNPVLWTCKFCILLAIPLVWLGLHQEADKRKVAELSKGPLFPEAH
jgi:hypothetical protein